ncbi:uncharacterized protein EAE97_008863 [Botrytis byssoidea]|uniref:Uncharacterized protein n=1 Tax=Botrytis byssoidea TaxID=139641 RepID=A0A9P5LZY1_9HELO|nr:uncharacterized protein EAE97_008863 [Botrytis byssoidea]KAF7933096.1 hypothetical protein EAE97_008863 [Botrytis byssoidea]
MPATLTDASITFKTVSTLESRHSTPLIPTHTNLHLPTVEETVKKIHKRMIIRLARTTFPCPDLTFRFIHHDLSIASLQCNNARTPYVAEKKSSTLHIYSFKLQFSNNTFFTVRFHSDDESSIPEACQQGNMVKG